MREAAGPEDDAAALSRFLDRHARVLVLTGAGCSAPSGIPDYRDADGECCLKLERDCATLLAEAVAAAS